MSLDLDHLLLRPGVHAVRRDDEHWQVGLDPDHTMLVRDAPGVREIIEALNRRVPLGPAPLAYQVLTELAARGLLISCRPERTPGHVVVRVVSLGLDLSELIDLLRADGVEVIVEPTPSAELTASLEAAGVVHVVGSIAPLPRGALDSCLADGTPHLPISGTGRPGRLRIGPFVDPGVTACLRCVDAHESARDPRRPLILEQLSALPVAPLPTSTRLLTAAWVAHDLGAVRRGERPSTWSTTVELGGRVPVIRQWSRHPHCGCSWDQLGY